MVDPAYQSHFLLRIISTTTLLGLVQHVQIKGGLGCLGKLLEVTVHFLGGLGSENLSQHLGENGELVWIVGQSEFTGI